MAEGSRRGGEQGGPVCTRLTVQLQGPFAPGHTCQRALGLLCLPKTCRSRCTGVLPHRALVPDGPRPSCTDRPISEDSPQGTRSRTLCSGRCPLGDTPQTDRAVCPFLLVCLSCANIQLPGARPRLCGCLSCPRRGRPCLALPRSSTIAVRQMTVIVYKCYLTLHGHPPDRLPRSPRGLHHFSSRSAFVPPRQSGMWVFPG